MADKPTNRKGDSNMEEENKKLETEGTEAKATETKTEPTPDERDKELEKYKRLLDKANSEAADYKRKWRAMQTEEEAAEQERAEHQKAMEAELAELKKQRVIDGYRVEFMKVGFDEPTATLQAKALADGDTSTMFSHLVTLTDTISKSAVAKAMDSQKGLSVGGVVTKTDVEKAETEALRKAMGLSV